MGLPREASALEILIRIPTRCALSVSSVAGHLVARARVKDDRGRPIAGLPLGLTVRPDALPHESPSLERARASTDGSGLAQLPLSRLQGPGLVTLRFDGDERHGACSMQRQLDPRKAFPRLTLDGPARLREDDTPDHARFEARTDSPNATLRARLWRGNRWEEVGTGASDPAGRWRFSLRDAHARGLGPVTLRVDLVADERRNEARVERTVVLTRSTQLSAQAAPEVALGELLSFRGSLTANGVALPDAVVAIVRDGLPLVAVRTNDRGAFAGEVEAAQLGEGMHELQVAFTPAAPGLEPVASAAMKVTVVPAASLTARAALWTGALLALALALSLTARRSARRRARRMDAARADAPPAMSPVRRLWRRLTASRVLVGRVVDGVTGHALTGARLVAQDQETLSADDGTFRLGPFDAVRVALDVGADGYAGERLELELPAPDAQEVRLWSWREAVLRRLAPVATRWVPGPPLGQRTLADLRLESAALLGARAEPFVAALDRIEAACYAPAGLDADLFRALLEDLATLECSAPATTTTRPRPPSTSPLGVALQPEAGEPPAV